MIIMLPLGVRVVFVPVILHLVSANQCTLCGFGTVCDGRGCSCRAGFQGKRWSPTHRNFVCKDINECLGAEHHCNQGTRCVNREGSYDCRCRWGWYGPWVTAQGQFICTEKSLCESVYHRCGSGTECLAINTTSYRCQCSLGYNSRTISKVDEIYTCSDIDECSEIRASGPVCGQNSVCTNTPGSFRCKCRPGFRSAWKDDMNCNFKVTAQKSVAATEHFNFYTIGLTVGVGVTVLILSVIVVCFILRRKGRRRKSSVKRRYHNNGQPLKISVLTGRESSYVNVILTSQDGQETPHNASSGSREAESKSNQHTYLNELLELEVNLLKDDKVPKREDESLTDPESGYVNQDSIKKAKRSLSQTEPARCQINIRRPYSDSTVRVSGVSEELQQRLTLLRKKRESENDLAKTHSVYDRLQRVSTASPQPSVGKYTEHIYASPDDSDELSDSGSVFDIYQPVSGKKTETPSLDGSEPNMIYEPVIYSLPNKAAKQERIYANEKPQ